MQSHEVKDYNIYAKLGQFQEAAKCLQTALKDKPNDLETFYMLHRLGEKVLDSTLKNKIDKVISENGCTKMNLAYGNLLLSKFEQQAGNYEKELDYLLKGHDYFFQSKKRKFEEELKYWFNILPRIEDIVSLKKSNENNHHIKPIFIVGLPRCGSTLIEKVITSGTKHIAIGEETEIFNFLIHQGSRTKILEAYQQRNLIQAASDYTFTDKSLENFFYIKFIKEIFPSAKVINCTRNILSSIMSILQTNLTEVAWAHDLKHIYQFFDLYHQKIECLKTMFPDFIYDLNYEKFINDSEAESKKLMEYCNLPWSKRCLEFHKRKDIVSNTASDVQIRKTIHKHSLNKYLPYKPFILKQREGENNAIVDKF
jgi:tetratricopeptide (TPR) repeat protein